MQWNNNGSHPTTRFQHSYSQRHPWMRISSFLCLSSLAVCLMMLSHAERKKLFSISFARKFFSTVPVFPWISGGRAASWITFFSSYPTSEFENQFILLSRVESRTLIAVGLNGPLLQVAPLNISLIAFFPLQIAFAHHRGACSVFNRTKFVCRQILFVRAFT